MIQLKRIIFLIHPNCYVAKSPDGKDEKTHAYWDRERKVEMKWKRGIDALGELILHLVQCSLYAWIR